MHVIWVSVSVGLSRLIALTNLVKLALRREDGDVPIIVAVAGL